MGTGRPAIVYRHQEGLYVNLTNRCPTDCAFCIKRRWKMQYRGSNLDLAGAEPGLDELAGLMKAEWARAPFAELVFCGYGEPTMRLDALLGLTGAVRSGALSPVPKNLRVRLNTNGLGSLVNGRDIIPELRGLVDAVHVSLNTSDPAQWLALMRPRPEYAARGFESVLEFIRGAVRALPETAVTAIKNSSVDLGKFDALVRGLGAAGRLRGRLEE